MRLILHSHNSLSGIQGGLIDEYFHLNNSEYSFLAGIDQALKTSDSPTFSGLSVLGDVGIGTSSPTEKLDVNGNILATGTINGSNLSGINTGDQDLSSYVTLTGTETLTNKTLTSPIINSPTGITKIDIGLGNVVNLDTSNASNITSGIISSSILPPVALTKVNLVTSETAQLALISEEGDVAVRSDLNKSYMKNSGTTGTMTDWTELQTPTDSVLSVNSKTGTVILNTSDISEGTNLYYTESRVSANSSVVLNTAKNSYPNSDSTKVGYISVTQAVDLDVMESDVSTNNAKVGITTSQASDIQTNNLKVTESTTVSTPLILTGFNISIPSASGTVNGYLSSTDWTTFNNKLSSFTETDPIFTASSAHSITSTDITNLGNLSGTNTGDQTDITGNAGTVTNGVYTTDNVNVLNDITSVGADIEDAVTKRHTQNTDTALGAGAVTADHGTNTTAQIINVCYSTDVPPTASTTTEGALWIKYTA